MNCGGKELNEVTHGQLLLIDGRKEQGEEKMVATQPTFCKALQCSAPALKSKWIGQPDYGALGKQFNLLKTSLWAN